MFPQYIILNGRAKDITGETFGRLTAIGPIGRTPEGRILWHCQCECGKTTTAQVGYLTNGGVQSCGCLGRERLGLSRKTHGLKKHPLYMTWANMINRCTNPNHPGYLSYGGRGISVCQEWMCDFKAFYNYATSLPDYGVPNRSLDRIDNSLGYLPDNLKWSTRSEQGRNTRQNRMLTLNGKTQCVSAWAEELGMSHQTLRFRLNDGWSVDRALSTPVKTK